MTSSSARTARQGFALSDAGREFWKHPSPWMIGATFIAALTARIVVGDWQITDAMVPVAMLAVFPFFEWIIHVFILHWRPRRVGTLTIDPLLAREHRRHHLDPRDIPLIFIPWKALLWALPLGVAIALLAFPRPGLGRPTCVHHARCYIPTTSPQHYNLNPLPRSAITPTTPTLTSTPFHLPPPPPPPLIHVFILHWRPRRVGTLTIDPLLAREHRRHHLDPRDIPLIFIPWKALLWVLPLGVAIALLAFPRLGLGLTYLVFITVLGLGYEWTHYLIHSEYKPKTRVYRAIWRNHRQHHYKNEHYWYTVTSSGTADRVLGTYPHPATTPNSPTAKNLHAGAFSGESRAQLSFAR